MEELTPQRCAWAEGSDLMRRYHDEEWGVPLHDDRALFGLLVLEGAQAGLSWEMILKKRDGYRAAFDGFRPDLVARYDDRKVEALLSDPGIVRNRLKIRAAIDNASALPAVIEEFGSFDAYVWGFVGAKPQRNQWQSLQEIPSRTAGSDALSKDMKRRGFRFVGSTICYAFMQSAGLVNDHTVDCFRYRELG